MCYFRRWWLYTSERAIDLAGVEYGVCQDMADELDHMALHQNLVVSDGRCEGVLY